MQRRAQMAGNVCALMPISDRTYRALCQVAAVALLGVFAYLLFQNLHRVRDQNHLSDFRHFYYAGEAMREHRNPYLAWKGGYVYPPLLAFLYMPLTQFPIEQAAQVAEVIDVAALFGGLVLASLAV